jgi:predicted transcriptional regulator
MSEAIRSEAKDITLVPPPLELESGTNVNVIKRGRGRPKGSRNESMPFAHYEPKRWEPWMDGLVIHSLIGKSNTELAKMFEITVTHVSNILSTKQAAERKEIFRESVLSKVPNISETMALIQEKGVKRLLDFMNNDQLATNSPLSFINQAKSIVQMTFPKNELPTGSVTNNIQQNILATNPEFMDRLMRGLESSNEVAKLHEEKRLKLVSGG